eukprot:g9085.t1
MPGLHGFGICNCAEESAQLGLTAKWLNPWIALDQATALNVDDGDIKTVLFKKYDERTMDDLGWVRTPPDDNELLAFIPFSSPVQVLQSIFVIGGEGGKHPRKVRLFANPPPACTEFSDFCDRTPEQEIDLAEDLCGAVEYPVRATKFSNLTMLVMHFQTQNAAKVSSAERGAADHAESAVQPDAEQEDEEDDHDDGEPKSKWSAKQLHPDAKLSKAKRTQRPRGKKEVKASYVTLPELLPRIAFLSEDHEESPEATLRSLVANEDEGQFRDLLQAAYQRQCVEEVWKKLDTNEDGLIALHEVKKAVAVVNQDLTTTGGLDAEQSPAKAKKPSGAAAAEKRRRTARRRSEREEDHDHDKEKGRQGENVPVALHYFCLESLLRNSFATLDVAERVVVTAEEAWWNLYEEAFAASGGGGSTTSAFLDTRKRVFDYLTGIADAAEVDTHKGKATASTTQLNRSAAALSRALHGTTDDHGEALRIKTSKNKAEL